MQAMYGRHGEAPLPVLAAASSADCFNMTLEAARIALKYMTPVMLLTDGYIGQASEPWRIPDIDTLPEIRTQTLQPILQPFNPISATLKH